MSKKKKSLTFLCYWMLFVGMLLFFGLTPYWYQASNPGPLSDSHKFLHNNCNACHTPIQSADPEKCRLCHDTNSIVFDRQVVSFHSTIISCKECHIEHLRVKRNPTLMDHDALTMIFKKQILKSDSVNILGRSVPEEHLKVRLYQFEKILSEKHPQVDPEEAILNCNACHSNQDPHRGFFGPSCIECHATKNWTVSGYIHPSNTNKDCVQCHIGPFCHYTSMFKKRCQKMIGKKADVSECYECHIVDSWQYVKDIGWFIPYSGDSDQGGLH